MLWNERLPPSATNVIQTHVKHLRRLLEPNRPARAPSRVLQTVGDCYALNPELVEIDLARFQALVDAATKAHRSGDDALAATQLDRALTLWHGQPFADTPILRSQSLTASILEQKRDALVRYGEVMMAVGAADEAIRALEEAIDLQPLDEAACAQLIRACLAAGRRARAFDVYLQCRRRLADELGVDPGPELVATYQELVGGSAPAGGDDKAAESWHVVPAQLPPDIPAFAGRLADLAELDAILDASDPHPTAGTAIAIDGAAGIGKTALAVRWAHRHAHRFPDGQLHVDLRGFGATEAAVSTAEAVRGFLEAFAVPAHRIPTSLPSQIGLYRSLLTGRRVLVLLDNARDAEQVRPLLPGAPGCLTIVTSRRRLSSLVIREGVRLVTLGLLSPADSARLISHRLGERRTATEPAAVDTIIQLCARLPLALAIVAARAAARPGFPLAAIADELDRRRRGLDAFTGSDHAADLPAAFEWSYQRLSPESAALFRVLGLHPGPDIETTAAANLADQHPSDTARLLSELTDLNLLTEHTPGRYRMHDLLHTYAAGLAETHLDAPARRASFHRLLDFYTHTAHAAAVLIGPHRDPIDLPVATPNAPQPIPDEPRAWAWFDAERKVLLTILARAASGGFDTHAWQLTWALFNVLLRQGHWHDLESSNETALAAARRLGNLAAQAYARRTLNSVLVHLGRFPEASEHLSAALRIYTDLDHRVGLAHTHADLDRLHSWQDRPAEALPHALTALELYRSAGHLAGQASVLNSAGWNLALLGRHEEALDYARRAMTLCEQAGDRHGQAATWDTIGYAEHNLGDLPAATRSYELALQLFHELGDLYSQSVTLIHLAEIHETTGDHPRARSTWQQALDILTRLDHHDAEHARNRLRAITDPGSA